MTSYHLVLLGLAALGTLACAKTMPPVPRCCAWCGWAAMALAMQGGLVALVIGGTLMMLSTLPMLRREMPIWLNLYRALGMAAMLGIFVALRAVNGSDICGPVSLPLLNQNGIVLHPLERNAFVLLYGALILLVAYSLYSLAALGASLATKRVWALAEILPTSAAVIGMAVRIS